MAEGLENADLVRRVRSGDTEAFEELYRRHAPMVRRIVGSMLRQPERVDDAVQDVFLKALERLGTLREPARLDTWLKAIARNVATDQLRARPELDLDEVDDELLVANAPSIVELGELPDLSRLVHGALAELSERDTQAIAMVAYLDATPAEIAEALGVSVGAAKVVVHRARRRLRLGLKMELLVRRRGGSCFEFKSLADDGDLVAAARHLAHCNVCQRAGSIEIGLYRATPDAAARRPGLLATVMQADGGRTIAVDELLAVGRECAGFPANQRLLLPDESVSRRHAEIRVSPDGLAHVVDLSTNGTRLNGVRIDRSTPVPLVEGDILVIGATEIRVHGFSRLDAGLGRPPSTMRRAVTVPAVMVVGDVIGFTSIAEHSDAQALGGVLHDLYAELRALLRLAGGTLGNLVGDAIFGVWELDFVPDAPTRAIGFARAATQLVGRLGSLTDDRIPGGVPLELGWAVGVGPVSMNAAPGFGTAVVGDAANVVFRVASLAGRDGRAEVLVTTELADLADGRFAFGEAELHEVKGRAAPVSVVPLVTS